MNSKAFHGISVMQKKCSCFGIAGIADSEAQHLGRTAAVDAEQQGQGQAVGQVVISRRSRSAAKARQARTS